MKLIKLAISIGTFVTVLTATTAAVSKRPADMLEPGFPETWNGSPDLRTPTVDDLCTAVRYIQERYYFDLDLCDQYSIPMGPNTTRLQSAEFHSYDTLTMQSLVTAYVDLYNFINFYFVPTCNNTNLTRPATLEAAHYPNSWDVQIYHGPDLRVPTVFDLQQANWWLEEFMYYSMVGCAPFRYSFGQEANHLLGPTVDPSKPITMGTLETAMQDLLEFETYYFQKTCTTGSVPFQGSDVPNVFMTYVGQFPASPTP
ncbi:hypothetical protein BC936DRAFT_142343 [Jimgerdemannia flammicorona]|uniref:Uncharacterized protein n=1 Tax=Jimgerdemannia flammicorona TaxID=994334 RepID=A0A433DF83_9FUNG|nr:hypothetical protein BC936DRAFT_142343 [Jimgerdemannia flammicorona]